MLVAYTVSLIEPALGAIERSGRTGFQNLGGWGVMGDEGETNYFFKSFCNSCSKSTCLTSDLFLQPFSFIHDRCSGPE